jgi:hypothetical protein
LAEVAGAVAIVGEVAAEVAAEVAVEVAAAITGALAPILPVREYTTCIRGPGGRAMPA